MSILFSFSVKSVLECSRENPLSLEAVFQKTVSSILHVLISSIVSFMLKSHQKLFRVVRGIILGILEKIGIGSPVPVPHERALKSPKTAISSF